MNHDKKVRQRRAPSPGHHTECHDPGRGGFGEGGETNCIYRHAQVGMRLTREVRRLHKDLLLFADLPDDEYCIIGESESAFSPSLS